MSQIIKLAGISGSLRKKSYNTALLKNVQKLLLQHMEMTILSIADIPLYNSDEDLPEVENRPEPVERFRQELAAADGIIIVSPEYNYSIPGILKNAIDWASRGQDSPLLQKPVALMGATVGPFGTARMHMAFLPIFMYLDMKVAYKPEVLVAAASKKFDEEGMLTDSVAQDLIVKKLQTLKDIIEQNKK